MTRSYTNINTIRHHLVAADPDSPFTGSWPLQQTGPDEWELAGTPTFAAMPVTITCRAGGQRWVIRTPDAEHHLETTYWWDAYVTAMAACSTPAPWPPLTGLATLSQAAACRVGGGVAWPHEGPWVGLDPDGEAPDQVTVIQSAAGRHYVAAAWRLPEGGASWRLADANTNKTLATCPDVDGTTIMAALIDQWLRADWWHSTLDKARRGRHENQLTSKTATYPAVANQPPHQADTRKAL
jgi:hypothetical protein